MTGELRRLRICLFQLGKEVELSYLLMALVNAVRVQQGDSIQSRVSLALVVLSLLQTLELEEDCLVRILDLSFIRRPAMDLVNMKRDYQTTIRRFDDMTEDECFSWTRFKKRHFTFKTSELFPFGV